MKSNERYVKWTGMNVNFLAVILLMFVVGCWSRSTSIEEELEVILEFNQYDLEDFCVRKSSANWHHYLGNTSDWGEVRYSCVVMFHFCHHSDPHLMLIFV